MKVKAVLVLSGMVLLGALRLDANDRLRVRASPSTSAELTVYVGMERNAQNRMLRVSAESDDFSRSSEIQIDGEASPRINIFHFYQLPSGWYDITAQLFNESGRAVEVAKCTVIVS